MDTQTIFHENGIVSIYPCSYEMGNHHIVAGNTKVTQKGKLSTDDDGHSNFMPYQSSGASRYKRLFKTRHGEVKKTKANILFSMVFPKNYGKALIHAMLEEEMAKMRSYVSTQMSEGSDEWESVNVTL